MYYLPFTDLDDNFENFKWRESDEYRRRICEECNGVSADHVGKPFDIVVKREPRTFGPGHPGAAIFPIEFAEFLILHDTDNRIVWGKVLVGKESYESSRYVTAYMPSSYNIHERGDFRSVYRICSLCGSCTTGMYECGDEYLFSDFADYDILFLSGRAFVLLSKEIVYRYNWSQHRDIELEAIPVRDCPLDGFRLPGDPDWAKICPDFKPNPRQDWSRPAPRMSK